jgi:hypothetical protein
MVSLYEKGDMPLPFRRILLARQPSPMSCPTVGGIIPKFEARSVVETGDHGLLKLVRKLCQNMQDVQLCGNAERIEPSPCRHYSL